MKLDDLFAAEADEFLKEYFNRTAPRGEASHQYNQIVQRVLTLAFEDKALRRRIDKARTSKSLSPALDVADLIISRHKQMFGSLSTTQHDDIRDVIMHQIATNYDAHRKTAAPAPAAERIRDAAKQNGLSPAALLQRVRQIATKFRIGVDDAVDKALQGLEGEPVSQTR